MSPLIIYVTCQICAFVFGLKKVFKSDIILCAFSFKRMHQSYKVSFLRKWKTLMEKFGNVWYMVNWDFHSSCFQWGTFEQLVLPVCTFYFPSPNQERCKNGNKTKKATVAFLMVLCCASFTHVPPLSQWDNVPYCTHV